MQQKQKNETNEIKETENFSENIKNLAVVILIVAVVGWLLFKYEYSANSNNNNQIMSAYTITDTKALIQPPTKDDMAKYNADAETKTVVVETNKGDIKIKLLPKEAPYTAASFMKLIDKGIYNGLIFHRVMDGFMIQGGDPTGTGSGGPGYKFIDEINPWSLGVDENIIKSYEADGYKYDKNLTSHKVDAGALAMANSGPNTNGSQFFIVTDKEQTHLNGKHTVFGSVVSGMDIVKAISKVPVDGDDKPVESVTIKRIYLE